MRKVILMFFLIVIFTNNANAQNAITGAGFTSGWDPFGAGDIEYFSDIGNGTFGKIDNPNGTGNQYFRLAVDWSGTKTQHTITPDVDTQVLPETEYNLNSSNTSNGSMYLNVANVADNYIFKTRDAGTNPSFDLIIFRVQGDVRSVSSVARESESIALGQTVTVTATLDGALSTGQGIYLRYTNNNFSSSTVVEMTGSGTTYSADIPAGTNTSGSTVSYYVFSSGDGLTISASDADWYTINLNNNSGSNYSYTVQSTWTTSGSGDGSWNDPASWDAGEVPVSGQPVTVENNISLDQNATVSSLIINSGVTLTVDESNTLSVSDGITGDGSITVNGTLQLLSGGYSSITPTYGNSSVLNYSTGGDYGQFNEWPATNSPNSVTINGSQVRLQNARTINGTLTFSGTGTLELQGA